MELVTSRGLSQSVEGLMKNHLEEPCSSNNNTRDIIVEELSYTLVFLGNGQQLSKSRPAWEPASKSWEVQP